MRCMVLNQDYQFLNIASWMDAICLHIEGKATAIAHYEDFVRSSYEKFQLPAVMVMNYYVRTKKRNRIFTAATKKNIFVRDNFQCQYCGVAVTMGSGTIDHVIPTCRGGPNTITNTVCSCKRCNNRKDNMTAEEYHTWGRKNLGIDSDICALKNQPRTLSEEEKIRVLLKRFKSKERKAWLKCLKDKGISLW